MRINKPRSLAGLGIVAACVSALAGSATYDFNGAPPPDLNFVGNAEWRADGGVNNSGYMALFDAINSQYAAFLIPDFDTGLVVKAFTFECDLRVGNPVGNDGRPADGFSINYARSNDPVVLDLNQEPPVVNWNNYAIPNAPEGGTTTGVSICFDTWSGNTWPSGETDIEGIIVRVDNTTVARVPMATRNGSCTDATSLQTGPYNAELNGAPDELCWAPLKVELAENGNVTVTWKTTVIVNNVPTGFAPSAGRIVFAGRTGGANENTHIDNVKITTIPSDKIVIGNATGTPVGFNVTVTDSGGSILDPNSVVLQFDGATVTKSAVTKDGGISTISYFDVASPLVPGSSHAVGITAKDTRGSEVSANLNFTVPDYATLPPAWAVTGVNTSQRGFNVKVHQTAARGQENTVARAEQQLQGLRGANVADLTGFSGGVHAETSVINYSQPTADGVTPEQNGAFQANNGADDVLIPGIPSATEFNDDGSYYTDNIAAEITTYLHFPQAGVYELIFNSDDGFRTTAYSGVGDVLAATIVGQADVGRGAADTVSTVYVPQAGYYPMRTVWFEGGGGANFEWSGRQVIPTTTTRQLLNSTAADSIKAYRSRTGRGPAVVSFTHPFNTSGNPYLSTMSLVAKIEDGDTAVDQASIRMLLNGTAVPATPSKSGTTTTVTYAPPAPLPVGNHELTVQFTAGAQTYEGKTTFAVTGVAVPPSLALPAGAVNTANVGFLVKTVQNAQYTDYGDRANDTYPAETQINGLLGLPNTADLSQFTGPGNRYIETGVVNYNQNNSGSPGDPADSGYFTGANEPFLPDVNIPGIPGIHTVGSGSPPSTGYGDNGTDSFSCEFLTVLQLPAGLITMNVNSDDGFIAMIGNPAEWGTLPVVVGEFSGGRGNGGGFGDGTTFSFVIQQAGLYPFRLVWYEGGGGANIEWSSRGRDPQTGYSPAARSNAILINDVNTAGHLKAYRYPIGHAGAPYVKAFAPGRDRTSALSQARAGSDAKVMLHVARGAADLSGVAVSMMVDGTAVTPTVTRPDGDLHIEYTPTTPWADGLHTAAITYGDRTVSWQFRTTSAMKTPTFFIEAEDFDTGGGQSRPEANQMPYLGGAYAGLTAVSDTDYSRGDSGSSPLYRHGVNPRVSMDRTGDRTRGVGEVVVNYKLGWIGGGQWYNYTRDIPAGKYNVYAAVSHGDAPTSETRIGGTLSKMAGGTETPLGVFEGPATGGWGNNALLPLKAAATDTAPLAVDLGGRTTLRYNTTNGDWDFMLLVPAADEVAPQFTSIRQNANGTITVEWTGGGTLQAAPTVNGPWQDVAGATSPFTFTPDQPALFGRLRK